MLFAQVSRSGMYPVGGRRTPLQLRCIHTLSGGVLHARCHRLPILSLPSSLVKWVHWLSIQLLEYRPES